MSELRHESGTMMFCNGTFSKAILNVETHWKSKAPRVQISVECFECILICVNNLVKQWKVFFKWERN